MKQNKKLIVWILVFGPIVAILIMLWLMPEFIENWFVPFSLTMIPFLFFLKLSGGYKGISTVVAIVVTSFTLIVSWWLFPEERVSGGVYILLWIVTPIVVWWDRGKLPR